MASSIGEHGHMCKTARSVGSQEAPAGSLQLTGVLGLAALVYGLYQLRGPTRRDDSDRPPNARRRPPQGSSFTEPPKQAPSSSAAQQVHMCTRSCGLGRTCCNTRVNLHSVQTKSSAPTTLAQAVQGQLAGVRQITISAPGVLLDEWMPDQLQVC